MNYPLTFEYLSCTDNPHVIFNTIWGSHAYGTHTPTSDQDSMGVFILEKNHYLTEKEPLQQCSDERNDHRFYALKHFLELAGEANPNLLDLLFVPADCVLKTTSYWQRIQANRHLFVSQKACKTYCEYAYAQIKKAKGCNKRINNPYPETPPIAEAFCSFIPKTETSCGWGRPIPLSQTNISLSHCHVAAVEHTSELFRLYDYGASAKGVFRNGTLVCESIPLEDEHTHFLGLLLFNRNAFEQAKRQHAQYWQWRHMRNETRWKNQEAGMIDYDAKNMMHTFRLLYSGINIIRHGEPPVRFTGERLAELMAIRAGQFSYEALIEKANQLTETLQAERSHTALPLCANSDKIKDLLLEVTDMWEANHA